jgi:hypothetical protein
MVMGKQGQAPPRVDAEFKNVARDQLVVHETGGIPKHAVPDIEIDQLRDAFHDLVD